MLNQNIEKNLQQQVLDAIESKQPLQIIGGNSKHFYGYATQGEVLSTAEHQGIIQYDSGELVITCRAGSHLVDVQTALAENNQMLAFEPPIFNPSATIGGLIACGFSGAARPWSGSLRDYLLGVKLLNGKGEIISFGGQVMKNVAGYDVSRLMAGAMGTLGVILEASFKVLPKPAKEATLIQMCNADQAIKLVNQWSGQALPLSAASFYQEKLYIRLAGAQSEVEACIPLFSNASLQTDNQYWHQLNEHKLDFFQHSGNLWRLSLPPSTPNIDLKGEQLIDWAGAQRWLISDQSASDIRQAVAQYKGHVTLFKGQTTDEIFHPLPAPLQHIHKNIKRAFDPHHIFNINRMNKEW